MKYYFSFLLLLIIENNFSQNLQLNFSKNLKDQRQYYQELDVKNINSEIVSISVSDFQLIDNDTLQIFQGDYSFIDKDPTAFYSLKDEGDSLIIGIGLFEEGSYFLRVTTRFIDGHLEYFTLN